MSKQIYFTDRDKELLIKIEEFRISQNLSSFVAAVRILCKNGLSMSDVVKNLK